MDPSDSNRHIVSFRCDTPICARHIGFSIGPFCRVDLSDCHASDQSERLGDSAIQIHAFSLPKRIHETKNTCLALPMVCYLDA